MDEARRRELRDAVRPQGDDLSDPLFAALSDELSHNEDSRRTQAKLARFDSALDRAIQTPPLPSGLLDRLQAALAAPASSAPLAEPVSVCSEPASLVETSPAAVSLSEGTTGGEAISSPAGGRRWPRRVAIGLFGGVALAGLAGTYFYLNRGDYSRDALLAAGRNEFPRVPLAAGAWKPVHTAPESATAFADVDGRRFAKGWQPWSDFNELSGVVYLLQAGRLQALLFQFPSPLGLPSEFPTAPNSFEDTANQLASAWTKNGSLFVLVINGGKRQAESVGYFRRRVQLT
jgi:hypothetical protein